MTRKDFQALADAIRDLVCDDAERRKLARAVAAVCRASNSRFDQERFYAACGL